MHRAIVGNPAAVALARGRPVALRLRLSPDLPSDQRSPCNAAEETTGDNSSEEAALAQRTVPTRRKTAPEITQARRLGASCAWHRQPSHPRSQKVAAGDPAADLRAAHPHTHVVSAIGQRHDVRVIPAVAQPLAAPKPWPSAHCFFFCEKLGVAVIGGDAAQNWLILRNADEATTGPASMALTDPDGNLVLIDQHRFARHPRRTAAMGGRFSAAARQLSPASPLAHRWPVVLPMIRVRPSAATSNPWR